ncbi:MAG: Flp pilus assembly protein CpaB [Alphaproteobacteria bacterium]|nr:Flp pilus assembly protein CpaB [Alphaproteobacteria bacterium]
MNLRNILIIFVAVIIAGMTAMMARNYLLEQREAMRQKPVAAAPQPVGQFVLVAKTSLKPGTFVQRGNLDWVAWPKEGLVKGYVVQGERKLEDFVGAVARMTINAGEPILDARFVKPGERGFMAAVLTPGNRAMTVPITATTGNAGFVFPGDLVDLILTGRYSAKDDDNEGKNQFASTILEGMRVLAIDQNTENAKGDGKVGAAPGRTATLEVTPKQAEIVALAQNIGQLSLSLRSLATESGATDIAANEVNRGKDGESLVVAEAADGESQTTKAKQDKAGSYVLDKELKFMLQERAKSNPGVTILRGSADK